MSHVRLQDLLDEARANSRAVAAFNVVDEPSMDAILGAAAETRSPVVVQASERTAKYWGPRPLAEAFARKSRHYGATAVLHLDHCTDSVFLFACLDSGWSSVLIDTSGLGFANSVHMTRDIARQAHKLGAAVEGEFERIGQADASRPAGLGPAPAPVPLEQIAEFLEATGVDCLGPALGTAHGMQDCEPEIDYERVRLLAPMTRVVLHGGSGLPDESLSRAVASGVTKVNFSTALKQAYVSSVQAFALAGATEPLELLSQVRQRVTELHKRCNDALGSTGTSR